MKSFRLLILCVLIICLVAFVSCGVQDGPSAPRGVAVEYETLTLRWDGVEGARTYGIRIEREGSEPQDVTVSKNYYSLEALLPGEYSITVTANGDGTSKPSSAIAFTRDAEVGLEFRLVDGEYEVSAKGSATGVIEIPTTYRTRPVTSVGEKAFFGAADVTEVRLPESIKKIGAYAFSNCAYLEKINLPSRLTSLGESAFSGCRALGEKLSIPDGIGEIPSGAFAYCSSVEEITFGNSVESIGENAFTDCGKIKSLSFPQSLKVIGRFAFAACADVESVSFPDGLEAIEEFAFSKAISLPSAVIPDSVRTIGKGAFYYCTSLSSVELGTGIESLGDAAFLDSAIYNSAEENEIYVGNWFLALKDTTALAVEIKDGTVGIANNAFYGNKTLTSVVLPDTVMYVGMHAFAASDVVSVIIGSGVKRIDDQAFLYCEKLLDVVLGSYNEKNPTLVGESSLKYIGNYAFMNCVRLERIDIPDTVREIGSYAFRNTDIYSSALTGAVYADNWIVDFNKTITDTLVIDKLTVGIARYSFYNCTTLKSVKIDGDVKYVCRGAFYNCTSLEKVTFPDTLEKIGDYAFYNCVSLKLTSLPPQLREIGRAAFYQCGKADNYVNDTENDILEIPQGVTYIGDYAFYGFGFRTEEAIDGVTRTAGIDIVTIGDGVEYIGKNAFRGFSSLKEVIILGAAVIGDGAFYECPSLETVTVSGKLTKVGTKAFYKCESLASASFPDTLVSIGDGAFYGCSALSELTLGAGLERIGKLAFYKNTALCGVTLPATLTKIDEQAFRGCTSLASLTVGASVEFVGAHAFYACDALTLYFAEGVRTDEWSAVWNSAFAPVISGCTIKDGYLVSLTVGGIANKFTDTKLSAPCREGFDFLGFNSVSEASVAEYALDEILGVDSGTVLYAVWTAKKPDSGSQES